jgi:methylation protein EvaC
MQLNREVSYGINKYSTYIEFKNKVEISKRKLKQIFLNLKKKNKKIIGYGATAKSSTVLNYCNIKNETLEYFLDTTPNKAGKYMPGTHICIKEYNKTLLNKANYVFLGAWNFKEEIFKKERRYIKNGGKFITHVPIPRII